MKLSINGFLLIGVMVALIGIILYQYNLELRKGKYLGSLIYKLPSDFNNKAAIVFWIVMLCFWIFFLAAAILRFDFEAVSYSIRRLIAPTLWIAMTPLHLLKAIGHRQFREKGIKIPEGIIYWKDIFEYYWDEKGRLEIKYINRSPFLKNWKSTATLNIDDISRNRVDELLNENFVMPNNKE